MSFLRARTAVWVLRGLQARDGELREDARETAVVPLSSAVLRETGADYRPHLGRTQFKQDCVHVCTLAG